MTCKLFLSLITLTFSLNVFSQDYKESIIEFQTEMNKKFKDPEKSPLTKKYRRKFKKLDFYPINEEYRVKADFERVKNAIPFQMKTTTGRLPTYEVYGIATFMIDNREYNLTIYQSHKLRETEEFKSHLFLPFTDLTNGEETYVGGRYIELEIPPNENYIIIDFNKAYNPYCAYNYKYSCPIPPEENDLKVKIKAGVKL